MRILLFYNRPLSSQTKNYKIMSDYTIIFMREMMTNGRPKREKKERKNLRFLFSSTVRKTVVRCSFFLLSCLQNILNCQLHFLSGGAVSSLPG